MPRILITARGPIVMETEDGERTEFAAIRLVETSTYGGLTVEPAHDGTDHADAVTQAQALANLIGYPVAVTGLRLQPAASKRRVGSWI